MKAIPLLFLLLASYSVKAQNWIKKAPDTLGVLIVEKFESAGPCCDENGNRVYDGSIRGPVKNPEPSTVSKEKRQHCNVPEKDLDNNVELYQQTQKNLFKNCNFQYIILSKKDFEEHKDKEYADINKFRYILKYTASPGPVSEDNFPKWVYYFYDRKTGQKSEDYIRDDIRRFYPLENLVSDLNKKYGR